MNDTVQEVTSKLQKYKAQGKTFYEASNLLREQGYKQAHIIEATAQFNYHNPESSHTYTETENSTVSDEDYQILGNRILADKERSSRLFYYLLLPILVGFFVRQLYRTYFGVQSIDTSRTPKNLWARGFENVNFPNIWEGLLFGVAGSLVTFVGLWLYFQHRDRGYKKTEKKIDNDLPK